MLRFNGTPVRNLAHLARLVTASTEDYLRFDLESGNKVRRQGAAFMRLGTAL